MANFIAMHFYHCQNLRVYPHFRDAQEFKYMAFQGRMVVKVCNNYTLTSAEERKLCYDGDDELHTC